VDGTARWESVPAEVTHRATLAAASEADLTSADLVVLELLQYRLDTATETFDEILSEQQVRDAARTNRDAAWLLITPPALMSLAIRLYKVLAKTLCGATDAVEVFTEPTDLTPAIDRAKRVAEDLASLYAVPVDLVGFVLEPADERCLRRLLRGIDSAQVRAFGEGQGGALTLRVQCVIDGGNAPIRVVKIASAKKIQRESDRFKDFVSLRLHAGTFPTHDSAHFWACGDKAAMVYAFAGGTAPQTLFEAMQAGDSADVVQDLSTRVLAPWQDVRHGNVQSLAAFLESFFDDVTLEQIEAFWAERPNPTAGEPPNPIPWLRSVMNRAIEIDLPINIAHGDLHSYNILADEQRRAWLIDFYHTGYRPAIFDFAYADVALLLHRLSESDAAVPCSYQELADSEAMPPAVRSELQVLRDAALARWGGPSEALLHAGRACAALRRLRFETTDFPKAKLVASRAAARARALRPDWESAPEVPSIPL
jgi:aminoglycoside phosphotransferase (APT) family kinase protein